MIKSPNKKPTPAANSLSLIYLLFHLTIEIRRGAMASAKSNELSTVALIYLLSLVSPIINTPASGLKIIIWESRCKMIVLINLLFLFAGR
jgi:hypothetical protein